jgi:hypothetical protein
VNSTQDADSHGEEDIGKVREVGGHSSLPRQAAVAADAAARGFELLANRGYNNLIHDRIRCCSRALSPSDPTRRRQILLLSVET